MVRFGSLADVFPIVAKTIQFCLLYTPNRTSWPITLAFNDRLTVIDSVVTRQTNHCPILLYSSNPTPRPGHRRFHRPTCRWWRAARPFRFQMFWTDQCRRGQRWRRIRHETSVWPVVRSLSNPFGFVIAESFACDGPSYLITDPVADW